MLCKCTRDVLYCKCTVNVGIQMEHICGVEFWEWGQRELHKAQTPYNSQLHSLKSIK